MSQKPKTDISSEIYKFIKTEVKCTRQSAPYQTPHIQWEFGVGLLPTDLLPTSPPGRAWAPETRRGWCSANIPPFVFLLGLMTGN